MSRRSQVRGSTHIEELDHVIRVRLPGTLDEPWGSSALNYGAKVRNSCTDLTAADPSPTAVATRFVEVDRTSPTAKRPGWLLSKGSGSRSSSTQRSSR